MSRWVKNAAIGILLILSMQAVWAGAAPATKPAGKAPLSQWLHGQITAVLDQLQRDDDFPAAQRKLLQLFDRVITSGPVKQTDAFRESAFALRLVTQLQPINRSTRSDLLKLLRASPALAGTLAFLIGPESKSVDVYALLDRLHQQRGPMIEQYATLTAAVCVVHDRPLQRRINENLARAADPLAIFDYFSRNEGRMFFRIKPVPAELLIYVVDSTASIDEMQWALQRYGGDPKVGSRFFDVKYDYDHLRRGTPKRLTEEGFNLPNILQFGGVCADQAYFASMVGKSIGVPTAIASASAGEMGHSWVGFFQSGGTQGWWNFDIGRYAAYRGIRGMVLDPQTRQHIPDSYVSILAELQVRPPDARHAAAALADAAVRLMELEKIGTHPTPIDNSDISPASLLSKSRAADIVGELELLEAAVRLSPGDRRPWFLVHDLAKAGKLSLDQKRRWAGALEQICGTKYPDFTVAVLTPMIQTVDDIGEQEKLWNEAFHRFSGRADLAAAIRMSQAAMWESHGQTDRAGMCYMDVIERFANAGPFVIDALHKAEAALVKSGRGQRVVMLYEQTWNRIKPPRDTIYGAFVTQSNWYRVGTMLAAKLEASGAAQPAAALREELSRRSGVADRTADNPIRHRQ